MATASSDSTALVVGGFSSGEAGGSPPEGWQPLEFKKISRHTSYALVQDGDVVVVTAESHASASGLVRRIAIDLKRWPVIEWRWKIANVLDKADVATKQGDDYPARIYVTFAYDGAKLGLFEKAKFEAARLLYGEYPPLAAINYIWDAKAAAGTMIANAYTSRVKMIVVESGAANVGRWVRERRDLAADYRSAFGEDPPPVSAVAIMTDTDNTGESATAWYGDIAFPSSPSTESDQHRP